MRTPIFLSGAVGLMFLLTGCETGPESRPRYPEGKQLPVVSSASTFDGIVTGISGYEGKEIKVAGRIQNIDSTEEGYVVFAKWLPYPKQYSIGAGPPDSPSDQDRHFVFSFRGKRKSPFTMYRGNKFIMEGRVQGTRKMVVDITGTQRQLLHLVAGCVRVWETGMGTMSTGPDSQYPDARAHTFCPDK